MSEAAAVATTSQAPVPAAAGTTTKKLVKRKPARKQVEEGQVEKKQPEQTGQTYNLWYNKWAGGDKFDAYSSGEKSQTRVNLSIDQGYTRADGGINNYICLFFARGCCPKGKDCSFLHRLPLPSHKLPDASKDCFGRGKHMDYRDDMGGVGSFGRQNRTLYIGRLRETRGTEQVLEKHFEEYGEIEKLRVLHGRGCGFVTYTHEISAQFAKEAMMHQSMDHDEILNVRWATEDPNPRAKVEEAARTKRIGEEGIAAKITPDFVHSVREMDELEGLVQPLPEPEDDGQAEQDDNGDQPPAKRQRVLESAPAPVSAQLPTSSGLLSSSALEGLKAVAAMRNKQPVAPSAPAAPKAAAGLGGLADYGSDSD